jgi:arginine utilization regulatory protein
MNMVGFQEETIGIEHFTPGLDCLEQIDFTCRETPFPLPGNLDCLIAQEPVKALGQTQPHTLAQTQANREKSAIKTALSAAEGNVTKAAKNLGISRQLLHYKINKYGFYRLDFIPRPTI